MLVLLRFLLQTHGSDQSEIFFNINVLPAYYIFKGFSIEPQFVFNTVKNQEPEFNFIGNLSYTIRIKESGFAPYLKLGYGVSNSVHSDAGNFGNYNSDEFDIGVFNSAAGLKFLVSKKIALRGELNFKLYSKSLNTVSVGTEYGTNDMTITNFSFLSGLSFLF